MEFLLNTPTTLFKALACQAHHVERIEHSPDLGHLLGGGALKPAKPVHRYHLHASRHAWGRWASQVLKACLERPWTMPGNYAWTKTTTLGAYFVSSTSSHYDWAMKKLRRHTHLLRFTRYVSSPLSAIAAIQRFTSVTATSSGSSIPADAAALS